MATYGPNGGVVPFTGFSPTLGVGDAATPATNGQIQFNGMTQDDNWLSYTLRRPPNRVARRLLLTVLGAAAGANASETRARVLAQQATNDLTVLGGLVPIESVSLINRVTTATDISNLTSMLTRTPAPAAYAADASGNAGGGKAGW